MLARGGSKAFELSHTKLRTEYLSCIVCKQRERERERERERDRERDTERETERDTHINGEKYTK